MPSQPSVQGLKSRPVAADERGMKARREHSQHAREVELPAPLGTETYEEAYDATGDPDLCRVRRLRLEPGPTDRLVACGPHPLARHAALPQLRVERHRASSPRTPWIASTASSTAACARCSSTLTRVTRACMEAEIAAFAKALESELIVPFDFTHLVYDGLAIASRSLHDDPHRSSGPR